MKVLYLNTTLFLERSLDLKVYILDCHVEHSEKFGNYTFHAILPLTSAVAYFIT